MSQRKQTDTPTEKRIEPFFIRYSNSQCTIDSQVMKQSARKLSSDVRVCSQLSSDHQYLYYLYLLVEKKNHQMKTLQKEVAYIKSNQLCLIKTRANSESKKREWNVRVAFVPECILMMMITVAQKWREANPESKRGDGDWSEY